MNRTFYLVDAFASRPFGGNPAGVVTVADGLQDAVMQQIARELGQSETCFVLSDPSPGIDFHLRWFTPTVEVDLCGHATVAAYLCLAEEGRLPSDAERIALRQRTRTGVLDVAVHRQPGTGAVVWMSTGVAPVREADDRRDDIACLLGLPIDALDPELPLAADDRSARLIVPIRRLDSLHRLRPNILDLVRHGDVTGYRRYTLVSQETFAPACRVHVRHFAPANGVPEDPVTGTAHAAIAVYLDWLGGLPTGDELRFRGEQGHAVGRAGVVDVQVLRRQGAIVDVWIGGGGFIVARGDLAVGEGGDPR